MSINSFQRRFHRMQHVEDEEDIHTKNYIVVNKKRNCVEHTLGHRAAVTTPKVIQFFSMNCHQKKRKIISHQKMYSKNKVLLEI